ncbi:MAG: acyclic terpene utilization AtuA family protein [Burkholderiales bacterium]|nr:acyclic terpene utilization AtuA family protein [Burkholderiales bacterium]
MNAIDRLAQELAGPGGLKPLRVLAASGQLGYGVPEPTLAAGLARKPHVLGADMGSIDPGPAYLGGGIMGTSPAVTRADLTKVLRGARALNIPLLIGTAGTAGARPHLEATLQIVRDIARAEGMHFRLASIRADMPRDLVKAAIRAGRVQPIGAIGDLTTADVDQAAHLVGQMGIEAFQRALRADADVVIAGRACDTAVFAAIPAALGYPMGPTMHMSKIIECCSICCVPGGRDPLLGTLEGESFILDSMNSERHATPMSVAAHSLYEQSDPYVVREPEGSLLVDAARYEALDAHRTRVSGARWEPAQQLSVKIEGAVRIGERAVVLAASADPRVIANIDAILAGVEKTVRELAPHSGSEPYRLHYRVYGIDGVFDWKRAPEPLPREIFILVECIAASADEAKSVATVFKQYMLHHGFPGRLSTGGNLAFPFTPPELAAGTAYRFNAYHVMDVDALEPLFPVEIETL